MWVSKFVSKTGDGEATVSAMIEPAAGHSLEELLSILKDCTASVKIYDKFLSFAGTRADLERIEPIALVQVMPDHRFSRKYL